MTKDYGCSCGISLPQIFVFLSLLSFFGVSLLSRLFPSSGGGFLGGHGCVNGEQFFALLHSNPHPFPLPFKPFINIPSSPLL